MDRTDGIRVIAFQEGDYWVAQALEYDIGAQARSLSELQTLFELTFQAEREASVEHKGEPFAGIPKAPQRFFDMWEGRTYEPVQHGDDGNYEMALCA